MFRIVEVRTENERYCVTDRRHPRFRFSLESDGTGVTMEQAIVRVNGWERKTDRQSGIVYRGEKLKPFTEYTVSVKAWDNWGKQASGEGRFSTGRLGIPWKSKWITDRSCRVKKRKSPVPFTFRKIFRSVGKIRRAEITATALGIYELSLNGRKVGDESFAPGLTSYPHVLQYQVYDVTELLKEKNEITAVVGAGWAAGRFTYDSVSAITEERQAFRMELFLEYEDGKRERICTDESWEVTREGNYRFGDFYDGEIYDARRDLKAVRWKKADLLEPKIHPQLIAGYGAPVKDHEILEPVKVFTAKSGERIYDFGQNFAGVISLKIHGAKDGQNIVIRHAEALEKGELWTVNLRSAKARAVYICREGEQEYRPRLTYMGFRYAGIRGIDEDQVEVRGIALYSDLEQIGSFSCSDGRLNRLFSNVMWSAKSNFVDIPTDCPQRDERLGWTGDIALFAGTACRIFDMGRFLDKWLLDMKLEQGAGGGLPFVIPKQGSKTPTLATGCWGDSCILVPWAQYQASGDLSLLRRQYPVMKKYLRAVQRWAGLFSLTKDSRRIWRWPFGFGDWCAPYGGVKDWLARGRWVSTAYWAHSCDLMARIAGLLGFSDDSRKYRRLFTEICGAYRNVFTDGKGNLKEEFQTGYVLPLAFGMVEGRERERMAENLCRLIDEAGGHLNTGFTGTPWILFALADNGRIDEAYRMLLQDTPPSWLYQVKAGGTTTWEQWDALQPDGTMKEASLNHYAYGAAAEFFFRRICGLEPLEGGYRKFSVRPVIGGDLMEAGCELKTPYGKIAVAWKRDKAAGELCLTVEVPVSSECTAELPDGTKQTLGSGVHRLTGRF